MRNGEKKLDLFKYHCAGSPGLQLTVKPLSSISTLKHNGSSTFTGRPAARAAPVGPADAPADLNQHQPHHPPQQQHNHHHHHQPTAATGQHSTLRNAGLGRHHAGGRANGQPDGFGGGDLLEREEQQLQGAYRVTSEQWPKAILTCEKNSHPFVRREVQLKDVVKVGRAIIGGKPSSDNCLFDCRVLSRNHALLWYKNRKVGNRRFYYQLSFHRDRLIYIYIFICLRLMCDHSPRLRSSC